MRWHVPSNSVFFAQNQTDSDQNDEVLVWNDSEGDSDDQPLIGDQLTTEQQHELKLLLGKYSDVLQNLPGKTEVTKYHILTGNATPVRLPPYRLPHAYRETVQAELKEMLENGIIEVSGPHPLC